MIVQVESILEKETIQKMIDPFLILSGSLAILAMLLPGISGSFIFLLLGVYPKIVQALSFSSENAIIVLGNVGIGIFLGILIFPKLIFFLLKNYSHFVLSFFLGMMIGSLKMVWPFWKKGETIDFPILPGSFQEQCLLLFFLFVGFFLFFILQMWEKKRGKKV